MTRGWRPTGAAVLGGAVISIGVLVGAAILAVARGTGSVWGIAVIFGLLGPLAIGWVLWRLMVRPMAALAARGEALSRDAGAHLPVPPHVGTRETAALARSLSVLSDSLRGASAVRLIRSDQATAELGEVLADLRDTAEALTRPRLAAADRHRLLARIDAAADRLVRLLDAEAALKVPVTPGGARIGPIIADLQHEHPGLGLLLVEDAEVPVPAAGLRLVLDTICAAVGPAVRTLELTARPDRIEVIADMPGGTGAALVADPPRLVRIVEAFGGRVLSGPTGTRIVIAFDAADNGPQDRNPGGDGPQPGLRDPTG